MNHDHNDLGKLAQLWQSHNDPFEQKQETFVRASRRESLLYLAIQGAYLTSALFVAWRSLLLLWQAEAILFPLACLCYLPIAAYMSRRTFLFYRAKKLALPASPRAYVQAMRHNLEVRRREHAWSTRVWPALAAFLMLLCCLALWREGLTLSWLIRSGIALVSFPWVTYILHVREPRIDRARTRKLDALAQSLGAQEDGLV